MPGAQRNQTETRRRYEARIQIIRDGLARGRTLAQIHADHRHLWPDTGNGQRMWRRDRAAALPGVSLLVAPPERVEMLPSIPCARVRHSTMLDPGIPLELPGERNARLWDGRAGTASIVPPAQIRNRAPLSAAPLERGAHIREDVLAAFRARGAA